jgi:hypothetical protein
MFPSQLFLVSMSWPQSQCAALHPVLEIHAPTARVYEEGAAGQTSLTALENVTMTNITMDAFAIILQRRDLRHRATQQR